MANINGEQKIYEPSFFGRYLLLKRIAVGGMAEIFRAKQFGSHGFEKQIALKRMLAHLAEDSYFVQMFAHEAKLAASLNHVNIVPIFDFGNIDDYYFIAMEYVKGHDVTDLLVKSLERNETIPLGLCCFIIREALNGMDFAHRKRDDGGNYLNLIHRDISPQNILLSYEGEVKIGDFGIAKTRITMVQTAVGVIKGKYSYMSPEQAQGKTLDSRSDLFSLGIIFYELLALRKMYLADKEADLIEKVKNAIYPGLDELGQRVPLPIKEVLEKALTCDVEMRYQTAAQFRNELEEAMYKIGIRYTRSDLAAYMKSMFIEDFKDVSKQIQEEGKLSKEIARRASEKGIDLTPEFLTGARTKTSIQVVEGDVVSDDKELFKESTGFAKQKTGINSVRLCESVGGGVDKPSSLSDWEETPTKNNSEFGMQYLRVTNATKVAVIGCVCILLGIFGYFAWKYTGKETYGNSTNNSAKIYKIDKNEENAKSNYNSNNLNDNNKIGTIDLFSIPDAIVIIDGNEIGKTPLKEFNLSEGYHDFILKSNMDNTIREFRFYIKRGSKQRKLIRF